MKRKVLSLGLLLLIFKLGFSQEIVKDSVKITKLPEVVVTAQYAPTATAKTVYKVKKISNKMIAAKAATNLTDLLRQELNMNFSFNPAFGTGVAINGVSKENIKILVDGVPLIGRVNGVLNLNQININDVDHIEIIEGPVSVFYGTDVMGGVINLITKKQQAKLFSGSIDAKYESLDLKAVNAAVGFKLNEHIFKIGAGYNYFNGLNTAIDNTRAVNWPKKQQYYTHLSYLKKIGSVNMRFSSDYSNELVSTSGEVSHGFAKDIAYTTKRFDNTLHLDTYLNDKTYLDFTASYLNYDRFDTTYKYDPVDNSSTLIANNANGNYFNTFFTKLQYSYNSKSNWKYALGLEYEANTGEGERILDTKKRINNSSVYASANYTLNSKVELQPAFRYTYNSVFKDLLSPAFNMKYTINKQHTFRFAYGNGFRAPSLKELYLDWHPTFGPFTYNITGNDQLKTESSHSFNIYYDYTKVLANGTKFTLEPAINYNNIKDLIGLSKMVAFSRHYINLNGMKSINFNLNTKYNTEQLKLNLGLSYLGRYLEYTEEFNSGNYMYTPAINTSISYNYKPLDLAFNMFYKYTGKQQGHYIENVGGTDVLQETTRADFSNLDFAIKKNLLHNKLSLQTGVKNIFDVTDIETYNQIGVAHERNNQLLGRFYFLKIDFKF